MNTMNIHVTTATDLHSVMLHNYEVYGLLYTGSWHRNRVS